MVEPGAVIHSEEGLMRTAIELLKRTIQDGTGGPFAAILATASGEVIAASANSVVASGDPTAHAEVNVIRLACRAASAHSLRDHPQGPLTLFCTCEPCMMCTGAIHWAGLPRIVAAASAADAARLGFIESPGELDPAVALRQAGINYSAGLLRREAVEAMSAYRGEIYNG